MVPPCDCYGNISRLQFPLSWTASSLQGGQSWHQSTVTGAFAQRLQRISHRNISINVKRWRHITFGSRDRGYPASSWKKKSCKCPGWTPRVVHGITEMFAQRHFFTFLVWHPPLPPHHSKLDYHQPQLICSFVQMTFENLQGRRCPHLPSWTFPVLHNSPGEGNADDVHTILHTNEVDKN